MGATGGARSDREFPNLRPEVVEGYRAAPDDVTAEVLDGELFLLPRPRPAHALAATELVGELHGPFRAGRGGPGGWVFLVEPELHLGSRPDIVDPDIAGWRSERLPTSVFDPDARGAITVPPDWVCEVLSEKTEALDRGKKRRIYRREGVRHLWLLDPREQLLEVYRLADGRWIEAAEFHGSGSVGAEPFADAELSLAALWGR